MKRAIRTLLALAVAGCTVALAPVAASAATDNKDPIPVTSDCIQGWYVNPDEGNLLPEQVEEGLLFDGPSLVHHATSFTLLTVPTDGSFEADVETGVAPLFKLETLPPAQYSTINKTSAGTWWSSKIAAADPGGQSNPVASPANLVGKWNYTEATTVFSFGVGYANDAGNKAVVSSVTFNETTYDLTCRPEPTPSPSPSISATVEPVAVAQLPVTGSKLTVVVAVGVGLLVLGGATILAARRRRST